ncbi:hypothetical protein AB835_07455 [Candidatus Endobugula sertula]|uniref:Protein-glutamine gamma-glutamyltransferase TgpA N-terminal domain-containing protein n=1 Tax=Candidatus Endobugula sertula TaxID=62101 RepID=A0A1D2QQ56_9GAMM|nr:hypothetical protein AB835_07455 [Candidatus Endobugula sertula]
MHYLSMTTYDFPLTRPLLIGLLTVYSSAIALHIPHLPWWVLILYLGVMLWRINILRERWQAPGLVIQIVLVISICLGLLLEYSQWFALDPMITFLTMTLSFKVLEIRHRRDYLVVIYLSYFVIACSFLFNQSVLHSLLSMVSLLITTAALIQLYCLQCHTARMLRLSLFMLLQSVALMLVLILVLPRLNPLWSVPLPSNTGVTGISDSMIPGDFSQLIRSHKLALRITFEDKVVDRSQMYWRGIVFDDFDGRRWQRSQSIETAINSSISKNVYANIQHHLSHSTHSVHYEVLMEPTGQHWLFGIPVLDVQGQLSSLIYTPQQEVLTKKKIHRRIKYRAISYINSTGPVETLTDKERRRFIHLPQHVNPET